MLGVNINCRGERQEISFLFFFFRARYSFLRHVFATENAVRPRRYIGVGRYVRGSREIRVPPGVHDGAWFVARTGSRSPSPPPPPWQFARTNSPAPNAYTSHVWCERTWRARACYWPRGDGGNDDGGDRAGGRRRQVSLPATKTSPACRLVGEGIRGGHRLVTGTRGVRCFFFFIAQVIFFLFLILFFASRKEQETPSSASGGIHVIICTHLCLPEVGSDAKRRRRCVRRERYDIYKRMSVFKFWPLIYIFFEFSRHVGAWLSTRVRVKRGFVVGWVEGGHQGATGIAGPLVPTIQRTLVPRPLSI